MGAELRQCFFSIVVIAFFGIHAEAISKFHRAHHKNTPWIHNTHTIIHLTQCHSTNPGCGFNHQSNLMTVLKFNCFFLFVSFLLNYSVGDWCSGCYFVYTIHFANFTYSNWADEHRLNQFFFFFCCCCWSDSHSNDECHWLNRNHTWIDVYVLTKCLIMV